METKMKETILEREMMDGRALATYRRVVLVGLIVLLLGACGQAEEEVPPVASPTHEPTATPTHEPAATPSQEPVTAPRWEPAECKVYVSAGSRAECGYLVVPEDRTQPDSGMIRLHAVVIRSRSEDPKPDPLVFLAGGPGASALAAVGHVREILSAILEERDLVVADQRGVGFSEPALDCPEYGEAVLETYGADVSSEEAQERMFDAMRACRDRLTGEGVNLAAYTSATSAADVHDLMEALGYDRYNLYGGSYGTRLALTIMRDYPDEVRSAVLDSVEPLQVDALEMRAVGVQQALGRVFEQCASSETCNQKHPDLAGTLFSLVDRLAEEPLPVDVRGKTYQVGADEFIEMIFMGMFEPSGISGLPNLIDQAADGQTSWLAPRVDMLLSLYPDILWEGMAFSVTCAEEVPFNSAEDAEEINAGLHPAIVQAVEADNLPWLVQFCEMWGAAEADPVEGEPVQVDVPALILTGGFDPVTPLDFANATAEYLPKAQSFVIPGHTHDVLSSSTCAREIMKQFLDAPEETPDASCLE
jgi:pimeloyl-ACP methyl ester carboxylesterase